MKKILITRTVPEECLTAVREEFEIVQPPASQGVFSKDDLMRLLPQADALFTVVTPCGRDLLMRGKKLRVVANSGIGYETIDSRYATEHKIAVVNTPTIVPDATAEVTLALMLCVMRGVVSGDKEIRRTGKCIVGIYDSENTLAYGKTVGILGFGAIGKAFARKARGCGMNILYNDLQRMSPQIEAEYGAAFMPFDDILRMADVVSIQIPILPETVHLIDREKLALMKSSAYLINTARGKIIDEAALAQALRDRAIRGAALDVYEFEPEVTRELLSLDNVVLAPHIGTMTYEVRTLMAKEALAGIAGVLHGEIPNNVVNPQVLRE